MKKHLVWGLLIVSAPLFGVSLNFSGNFRTDGSLYSKLGLGLANKNSTKTFLAGRALLQPKLVIDDHFSLNTQWSLLTSPTLTPGAAGTSGAGGLSQGQGSYVFGDPNTSSMVLSRAWLEWVSDFGVVRVGRMPVSWGYGLIYDAGNGVCDDFQSTFDRLEYRLHFGHVIGALAYSKALKGSVLGNDNDQEFYSIYFRYDNPEEDVEAGVMYERQIRSPGQSAALLTTANPLYIPAPTTGPDLRPNLAKKAPYPKSNNLLDIYVKKSFGYFTVGGELGWLAGSAADYNGNGIEDSLNAIGLMMNVSYEYHQFKAFLDFLYASGDAALNSDRLNGFALLHRNRRPGLILGRELLGNYYDNSVARGSPLYYGGTDVFSGVYYFRPGMKYDWSESWSSGLEVIIAQKAAKAAGEAGNLGVEIDFGTEHAFYKNFDVGVDLAYLIPGLGLGVASPQGAFAFRTTASVKF